MNGQYLPHSTVDIVLTRRSRVLNINRKRSTGDEEFRCSTIEPCEPFRVHRSTLLSARSCASSMMMQLYWSRSGLVKLSLSSTPSVMYLIFVSLLVQSSKRIA
ncbi:hypothetical protein KC349_g21 [Hortaea werneckii]|nr:hypothetical protein KC349_g21 [Hortaea werneckii]